jgi:uncharacterized membrane protein YfcA
LTVQPLWLPLLFAAAVVGGGMNGLAGGGSFVAFPALVLAGVPPVNANATNTVALWPGSLATGIADRREVRRVAGLLWLAVVSVVGGTAGAVLLLRTPQGVFLRLVPFLMLGATVLFAFGSRAARADRVTPEGARAGRRGVVLSVALQAPIAVYGGYFGGGIGILMLAAFAALGLGHYHVINGLKNVLATCINGVAVVTFAVAGAVSWMEAGVMVVGGVVGGRAALVLARRLPPAHVRVGVIAIGLAMSVYLFVRSR